MPVDMIFNDDTGERAVLKHTDYISNMNNRYYPDQTIDKAFGLAYIKLAYPDIFRKYYEGSPLMAHDSRSVYYSSLVGTGHGNIGIDHICGGSFIGVIANRFSRNIQNDRRSLIYKELVHFTTKCFKLWTNYMYGAPSITGKAIPTLFYKIRLTTISIQTLIFQTMWSPDYHLMDYKHITTQMTKVNGKMTVTVEPLKELPYMNDFVECLLNHHKWSINMINREERWYNGEQIN